MRALFWILGIVCLIVSCKKDIGNMDRMILIRGQGALDDYWMDVHPVTVEDFKKFIDSTHYLTQADSFGNAGVFDFKTGSWSLVDGANWMYPRGKDSASVMDDHPVTQVSWYDAVAYCTCLGKRLPTTEEFRWAEKNGDHNFASVYTWGTDDFLQDGKFKANFWQGSFPFYNSVDDGFLTTSPVGYFGKNALGLMDLEGNVWQWCSDGHPGKPEEKLQHGGSYLCDPAVCHGFRIGGQASSTPETSLMHVGFRCVKDSH